MSNILGPNGQPYESREAVLAQEVQSLRRQIIRGKYDAAADSLEGQAHWLRADHLDPHAAANPTVRRKLRSRSRYEILENNPYLKGTILTIANDFVGGGPRLKITDKRLSKKAKQIIELKFKMYAKAIKLRKMLWRMRLAKIVDGETFAVAYINNKLKHSIKLAYHIVEAERISSAGMFPQRNPKVNEIDGVRFDDHLNPTEYRLLHRHPGSQHFTQLTPKESDGVWINQKAIIHWFRQDRGWLRGIPELTPSLPLCSLLRRYTLAIVRWAEGAASVTGVLETEAPAGVTGRNSDGSIMQDDPFDTFPIERGMLMNLPWGYKFHQTQSVPLGVQYDEFVGAVLREITRPALTPYNIATGSSKDSNMASSVVDQHLYKGGQHAERFDCDAEVLEQIVQNWWELATRTPGYFEDDLLGERSFLSAFPSMMDEVPVYEMGWDNIGLDHTDPSKVAKGIETLSNLNHMTDRDIQQRIFNRDVEDWRDEVREDIEFNQEINPEPVEEPSPSNSNSGEDDG